MTWPPETLTGRIVVVLIAVLVMWRLGAWMGIPIWMTLTIAGAAAIVVARQIIGAN